MFPFEVVIEGVPLSRGASSRSRERWKENVRAAALQKREQIEPIAWLDDRALAITICFFAGAPIAGDLDNLAKTIIDALKGVVYLDDGVIERIARQKFEPSFDWEIIEPSEALAQALDIQPPVVYIRVDDDQMWRTFR
jgi:hypothetical protein